MIAILPDQSYQLPEMSQVLQIPQVVHPEKPLNKNQKLIRDQQDKTYLSLSNILLGITLLIVVGAGFYLYLPTSDASDKISDMQNTLLQISETNKDYLTNPSQPILNPNSGSSSGNSAKYSSKTNDRPHAHSKPLQKPSSDKNFGISGNGSGDGDDDGNGDDDKSKDEDSRKKKNRQNFLSSDDQDSQEQENQEFDQQIQIEDEQELNWTTELKGEDPPLVGSTIDAP